MMNGVLIVAHGVVVGMCAWAAMREQARMARLANVFLCLGNLWVVLLRATAVVSEAGRIHYDFHWIPLALHTAFFAIVGFLMAAYSMRHRDGKGGPKHDGSSWLGLSWLTALTMLFVLLLPVPPIALGGTHPATWLSSEWSRAEAHWTLTHGDPNARTVARNVLKRLAQGVQRG